MNAFLKLAGNKTKMAAFMLSRLPSAWFSGVRLREISEEHAAVSVPYKWFSTNPFRSTYFACLAMAAEMSSGVLAMMHTYQSQPPVSMLVLQLQGEFFKKATGRTIFICNDGAAIKHAIETAKATKEPQAFTATAKGFNQANELVAQFTITWTFKSK